jgi:threonine dehydratase
MSEPTLNDIRNAAQQIAPLIHRTPVLTSQLFNREAGCEIFLKCENFQRGGAFKMRGAAHFLLSLNEEQRQKGVITYSSGNHGQAVAIAAEQLNVPATIVMPSDAPKAKVDATRSHGATVIIYDRHREKREEIGNRISSATGATLIPPFDHRLTITGQATAALEFMEDVPDLDTLLVCLGGGGLLAGTLLAAKSLNSSIRVFGVEPELANDWALSLNAHKPIEIEPSATIADGLRSPRPGDITFPIVEKLGDGVLLVTEDEIKATVRFLLTRMKIVVEPSGAVAAAAALHGKVPGQPKRLGILITGGNIDLDLLAKIASETP